MGNFFTDALGKLAGNVTSSVASAVIVTLITTYVLVDIGKKDGQENKGSAGDTASTSTVVREAPAVRIDSKASMASESTAVTPQPVKQVESQSMNPAGYGKSLATPVTGTNAVQQKEESPVTKASDKAFKELSSDTVPKQKPESAVTEEKANMDTALKAQPQTQKMKEVKKEEKKPATDVHKRADEVFDELDQETQKKPEQ